MLCIIKYCPKKATKIVFWHLRSLHKLTSGEGVFCAEHGEGVFCVEHAEEVMKLTFSAIVMDIKEKMDAESV